MNLEQFSEKWGQIVTNAWQDDAFKMHLLSDPSAVFKETGLEVPAGVQVRVVENTDRVVHLTLPAKPREGELSDAELEGMAGGLVVPALIAIIISPLLPAIQKEGIDMSPDQRKAVAAGQPMPRPR